MCAKKEPRKQQFASIISLLFRDERITFEMLTSRCARTTELFFFFIKRKLFIESANCCNEFAVKPGWLD